MRTSSAARKGPRNPVPPTRTTRSCRRGFVGMDSQPVEIEQTAVGEGEGADPGALLLRSEDELVRRGVVLVRHQVVHPRLVDRDRGAAVREGVDVPAALLLRDRR